MDEPAHQATPSPPSPPRPILAGILLLAILGGCSARIADPPDALSRVRTAGQLLYGTDAEGGGPYAYPDPDSPREVTGFEVELMDLLCGTMGPTPRMSQCQWDMLLPTLSAGRIDVVVNGYEWTPNRARRYLATRPYYVYQLQVMAPKGGPVRSFDDLTRPRPGGGKWRVAVLGGSAPETYLREHAAGSTVTIDFNGATDAMMAVKNGQADATLQDLPAARFYRDGYPTLELAGPPVGRGFYVMYLRQGDEALRDSLDRGIARLARSGGLRTLYERYGIWTDLQTELAGASASEPEAARTEASSRGATLIRRYGFTLLLAAGLTVFLSITSMPLAIGIGLLVAIGRLYGPRTVRPLLAGYVEFLRGTPLMLQLYVLFFLLPEVGVELHPLVAGVLGLAINYSAYEAEIYRAGLLAVPKGQMEAALSLGMSRPLALRRIIVPQAVRIVIPPVTNDFIALFKDTSVCSVISLVELTKQYSILANSTGGVVEFALATAFLYLVMSLPLSWFSRWFETKLDAEGARKGVVA